MLDTAGLIDLETRLGAAQLPAARRGADRGRGRLGLGHRGQPLPRLPRRLLGGEPGPLPPEDPRRDGRAGAAADADLAAPSATTSSGRFYEELAALTSSHKVLPMNSGAEAVETAIKAVRKWGYEVKGVPEGAGRDHRLRRQLPRPHARRSSASRPTRTPAAASARSRRASASCRSATPTRFEAAITPEHRRLPGRADPGRGRRHHPAGRLLHARARALHRARRHADPRRDPDRPRPHRQAARRGARGHRGRRDADRQGARRRLLPGLGGALELRRARRAASPASTARPSAATRSPARSRAPR